MQENWLTEIKEKINELEVEYDKFYVKNNKSAGTRARKLLQEIKQLSQIGRTHIQDTKANFKN